MITDQWVNGVRVTGEVDSDDDIVDSDDSNEQVNVAMHWNNSNDDYVVGRSKKKTNNFKNKQSHKSFYKKDLKSLNG